MVTINITGIHFTALTHHVHSPLDLLFPSEPEAIITESTTTSFLQQQTNSPLRRQSRFHDFADGKT
jgi:hypothetical protein